MKYEVDFKLFDHSNDRFECAKFTPCSGTVYALSFDVTRLILADSCAEESFVNQLCPQTNRSSMPNAPIDRSGIDNDLV
jgi:hypothetical protein